MKISRTRQRRANINQISKASQESRLEMENFLPPPKSLDLQQAPMTHSNWSSEKNSRLPLGKTLLLELKPQILNMAFEFLATPEGFFTREAA